MSVTPDDVASTLLELEDASASKKPSLYSSLLEKIIKSSASDSLSPNLTTYVESLLGTVSHHVWQDYLRGTP